MKSRIYLDETIYPQTEEKVIDFIMKMNGFTNEEFTQKYNNDAIFHRGIKTLTQIFVNAEV